MVAVRHLGQGLVALLLAACSARREPLLTPPVHASAFPSASVAPSASTPRGPAPLSAEFTRALETMDALDLSALAATEGADRLASLLDDPRAHDAALAAIPYADDAELAFARLARRARENKGMETTISLDAFVRSLEHPTKRGEILDDDGVHAAIGDLRLIAADASRASEERAIAATILRRLADRGFLDRATVPAPD